MLEEAGAPDLIKIGGQIGSQLHDQIPPHLNLGEQEGLCSDVDGRERLHEELHAFGATQDVWKSFTPPS